VCVASTSMYVCICIYVCHFFTTAALTFCTTNSAIDSLSFIRRTFDLWANATCTGFQLRFISAALDVFNFI